MDTASAIKNIKKVLASYPVFKAYPSLSDHHKNTLIQACGKEHYGGMIIEGLIANGWPFEDIEQILLSGCDKEIVDQLSKIKYHDNGLYFTNWLLSDI